MGSEEEDSFEDLCVRGYQSKLFDDSDRATEVNSGKTLICWMGILMDRFDCRGHLMDISPYDADLMDKTESDTADPFEAALEKTLDEERYLELFHDIRDEETLQVEEQRRLTESTRKGYCAVQFQYNESTVHSQIQSEDTPAKKNEENVPEEDELYELPPELRLPYKMEIPQSDKIAQIIERTSQFIAQQGVQMEILIKTKQANNPQFDFLRGDNSLHPFYRFMVSQMKEGRYRFKPRAPKSKAHLNSLHEDIDKNASQGSLDPVPTISFPKVDISNTSYALLINKFRERFPEQKKSEAMEASQGEEETQSVVSMQEVNEDKKELENGESPKADKDVVNDNSMDYHRLYEAYYNHYFHFYYNHYYQLALSNASDPSSINTSVIAGTASSAAQSAASAEAAKILSQRHDGQSSQKHQDPSTPSTDPNTVASESLKETPKDPGIPTDRERAIIDKMAEYVARNGSDFEAVVRAKDETRFQFLDPDHPLNPYYRKKKREAVLRNAQSQARKVLEAKGITGNSQENQSSECHNSTTSPVNGNEPPPPPAGPITISFSLQKPSPRPSVMSSSSLDPTSIKSVSDKLPESEEERERKRAQHLLLDKLANEARSKIAEMARKSKEDEVRAERKRKAELFLSQRKVTEPNSSEIQNSVISDSQPISPSSTNEKSEKKRKKASKDRKSREKDKSHRKERKRSRSRSAEKHRHKRH